MLQKHSKGNFKQRKISGTYSIQQDDLRNVTSVSYRGGTSFHPGTNTNVQTAKSDKLYSGGKGPLNSERDRIYYTRLSRVAPDL